MMNKLIDKIVDVTAVEIPGVCQLEYESGGSGVEFSNPALERFVELVVKECLFEIESVSTGDYGRSTYDAGYDAGLVQASKTIKEHFGIKE
jgi:hypothetical protein